MKCIKCKKDFEIKYHLTDTPIVKIKTPVETCCMVTIYSKLCNIKIDDNNYYDVLENMKNAN